MSLEEVCQKIKNYRPKSDLKLIKRAYDFSYAVHTELGDACVGARVNGKLAPLGSPLKTNQVVEILTAKNKRKPSADWLKFVKTQAARSKIRKSLRARV